MSVLIKFAIVPLAIISTLASSAASAEEKKVQIDDVPPAVKTAIEEAVGGGRLVDIGEVTTDAEKTYEIEMHVEGKEIDVVFDSTGQEISRSDEAAVEEKEGEDETGDKFQHALGRVQDEGLLLVKQGFGNSPESEGANGNDLAGVYNLVSVNRHELPATVFHGDVELIVRSGSFTINADGTCSSKVVFGPSSGAAITRDVNATYTRDGSKLNMQWVGAGKTAGIIKGENFTMDNEGMAFAYTKQAAIVKQKVLDRFIGKWRSLSAPRESAEEAFAVDLTYRRILAGKFVEEEGEGADGSTAKLIYTYDPEREHYRLWSFRSSMQPSEATGEWDADTKTLTWTYVVNEGQDFVTVATHRFVDDDTFEWDAEGKDASGEVVWRVDGKATRISESKE